MSCSTETNSEEDHNFLWTSASSDTFDDNNLSPMAKEEEPDSDSDINVKMNLMSAINGESSSTDSDHKKKRPSKRKIKEEPSDDEEMQSPRKKKIKTEEMSDEDLSPKKKKKHKTNKKAKENKVNDTSDEYDSDILVKKELLKCASNGTRRRKHRDEEEDSVTDSGPQTIKKEQQYDSDQGRHKKHKRRKKDKKAADSDSEIQTHNNSSDDMMNHSSVPNGRHEVNLGNPKSRSNSESSAGNENGYHEESPPIQKSPKKKKTLASRLLGSDSRLNSSLPASLTSSHLANRLQFEKESPSPAAPSAVRSYARLRPQLSAQQPAGVLALGPHDDVWLLRAPRGLSAQDLDGATLDPAARGKVKAAGVTYDVSVGTAAAVLAVLSEGAILALKPAGELRLRRRLPRAPPPSSPPPPAAPPSPPPPPRARHPLLGHCYKQELRRSRAALRRAPPPAAPAPRCRKERDWDSERGIEHNLFRY